MVAALCILTLVLVYTLQITMERNDELMDALFDLKRLHGKLHCSDEVTVEMGDVLDKVVK